MRSGATEVNIYCKTCLFQDPTDYIWGTNNFTTFLDQTDTVNTVINLQVRVIENDLFTNPS